jgi:hypothetical protein
MATLLVATACGQRWSNLAIWRKADSHEGVHIGRSRAAEAPSQTIDQVHLAATRHGASMNNVPLKHARIARR